MLKSINHRVVGTVSKLIITDPDISIKAKGLYAYLSVMADDRGEVQISRTNILEDMGICTNTYDAVMRELKGKNIVEVVKNRKISCTGRGCNEVNTIRIKGEI
jgi:hypothetical protein